MRSLWNKLEEMLSKPPAVKTKGQTALDLKAAQELGGDFTAPPVRRDQAIKKVVRQRVAEKRQQDEQSKAKEGKR